MLTVLKALEAKKIKCISEPMQLRDFSYNYGGTFSPPGIIVEPKNRDDIIQTVKIANKYKVAVAVKGFGHSTGKQHETNNGILINIRTLKDIHELKKSENDLYSIDVDAGVSWGELINTSLSYDLIPYVYTDWLELTLGGTLSLGGIGAASFRYGIQSDYLLKTSIVSKLGECYTTDKNNHSALFYAAASGLGQFGILTGFEIALRKGPKNYTIYKKIYTDFDRFFKDSFDLIKKSNVEALIAHFECNVPEIIKKRMGDHYRKLSQKEYSSSKWIGILEVTKCTGSPCSSNMFQDYFKETCSIKDYLYRVPPILDSNLEKEHPPHTEATLLIPYNQKAISLFYSLLNELSYDHLGFGTILFIPMKRSVIKSPFFVKPKTEYFFLLGILSRKMNQTASEQFSVLIYNFYKSALAIGACHYPCDSLETPGWAAHFGNCWEEFLSLKETYDPNNIYSPGLSIRR